jgi:hypothetical protein
MSETKRNAAMRKRLPVVLTAVIVIGLLLFAGHTFDVLGLARSIHGG